MSGGTSPPLADQELDEIRQMVASLEEKLNTASHPANLPDPDIELDFASRAHDVRRVARHVDMMCRLHVAHFRRSNEVKLALLLKGYLSAHETQNSYVAYHLARAVLELATVLFEVTELLNRARTGVDTDWRDRGRDFHAAIVRARYASTDEVQRAALESVDSRFAGAEILRKFSINKIQGRLAKVVGFEHVVRDYSMLNNYVHPNSSSMLPAVRGSLMSNVGQNGRETLLLNKKMVVLVYEYPPLVKAAKAIMDTAKVMVKYAEAARKWLAELPDTPFSDVELVTLIGSRTGSWRVQTVPVRHPATRVSPRIGRNTPCPCGSGKKYKHCCGN